MANLVPRTKRWVFIEARPEIVFDYLTDLSNHGAWERYEGFAVVGITSGPVEKGSFCQRERIETLQAPILRGGGISNQVTWIKSLTVVGCEPNLSLDFETKNLYNGLSLGSEFVSFRLNSASSGTVLTMTDRKDSYLPGPFHVFMMGIEVIKSWLAQPVIGFLFWLFPALRVNSQLKKIKSAVEQV